MAPHCSLFSQLTVLNKDIHNGEGQYGNKMSKVQFKVKENSVEYFYPGSRA